MTITGLFELFNVQNSTRVHASRAWPTQKQLPSKERRVSTIVAKFCISTHCNWQWTVHCGIVFKTITI
eukprot:6173567-Pleurochrysis_carterae.AAC.1